MRARDAGVTLVEVLVGMALFGVLSTTLLGISLSTSRVTEHTRQVSEVNEELQLTVERITRELRQARQITLVDPSTGAADPASLRFEVDFDGEGEGNAPVSVLYTWDPSTAALTITEGAETGTLAAGVTGFVVTPASTLWQYDADGDGDTTWQELDAAGSPAGNGDGVLNAELPRVDRVEVVISVERDIDGDPFEQTYVTKVDMRNVDPNQ